MAKYRYGVLTGDVAIRVRELVMQTCEAFEIRMVKGVVSGDHVHILVSAPPELAPSEIMRRLKGRSVSKLFEKCSHLKKRFWASPVGAWVFLRDREADDGGDDQAVPGALL